MYLWDSTKRKNFSRKTADKSKGGPINWVSYARAARSGSQMGYIAGIED